MNTSNNITDNITFRAQANYHQGVGANQKHLLGANLGYEVSTYKNKGFTDQTRGYFKERGMKYLEEMTLEEILQYPDYAQWTIQPHRTVQSTKTNKISGYLTMTYSYDNYFTVNMNGRFDASNKFGSRSNKKFLPIWSVSGMFNIKETLCKNFEAHRPGNPGLYLSERPLPP